MSNEKNAYIPDPTIADGFDGLHIGNNNRPADYEPEPLNFDLHAAAKYVRQNNLDGITEEIKKSLENKHLSNISGRKRRGI